MKVLAAMSGGVDSAVAAARMVEAGHDVTGVHFALTRNPQSFREGSRGCCSLEDSLDARRAADLLGIPFYVWDLSEEFRADVVEDFLDEYRAGRTPNPCLRCNETIKFAAVLARGMALGFDAVATGHYARRLDGPAGPELRRAVDQSKDQSYVLGVLDADQLAHSLFPLGESTKEQVRAEASARGLSVADKPDSHDICFIPDGDTAGFLDEALGAAPGDIVDEDGAVVGTHGGAHRFTIGQRRGLGLGVPAPDGKPRYVLSITPTTRTVTVGPRESLAVDTISSLHPVWAGAPRLGTWSGYAQVRAHGAAMPVQVEASEEQIVVRLAEPAMGIAPGQAVVLYESDGDPAGDRVVGSATIESATRAAGTEGLTTQGQPAVEAQA